MKSLELKKGDGSNPSSATSFFRFLNRLKEARKETDNPEAKKLIERTIESLKKIRK